MNPQVSIKGKYKGLILVHPNPGLPMFVYVNCIDKQPIFVHSGFTSSFAYLEILIIAAGITYKSL